MKKDEILNASRKEHRNKDLAEMEMCIRDRVSATVLMVSTTLAAMQSQAALATWRRRSL